MSAIAYAASRSYWQCLGDIDIPIRQRALSIAIDKASFFHLISFAPSTHSCTLALSSSLPHVFDWLTLPPWATVGSDTAYVTG